MTSDLRSDSRNRIDSWAVRNRAPNDKDTVLIIVGEGLRLHFFQAFPVYRGPRVSLCHLSAKQPLCPYSSCDDEQLAVVLEVWQIIFPNEQKTHELSVWLWAHCLKFFVVWPSSLLRTCAGRGWSSVCLNTYSRQWAFLGKCLYPPMWIMRKFHSSSEDSQRELSVCTDNNVMLWQTTSLYTTVWFHWYTSIMKDSDCMMWVK